MRFETRLSDLVQRWVGTRLVAALLLVPFLLPGTPVAAKEKLELHYSGLELPAAPSVMLPADLNDDGKVDIIAAARQTKNLVIFFNERD